MFYQIRTIKAINKLIPYRRTKYLNDLITEVYLGKDTSLYTPQQMAVEIVSYLAYHELIPMESLSVEGNNAYHQWVADNSVELGLKEA